MELRAPPWLASMTAPGFPLRFRVPSFGASSPWRARERRSALICCLVTTLACCDLRDARGADENPFGFPAEKADGKWTAMITEGRAALKKQRFDTAIPLFSQLLKVNRDPQLAAWFLCLRAEAYIGKGQLSRAMKDADEAIRLRPKFAPAYVTRGVIFRHRGETNRAIREYDAALRFDPKYIFAYNSRGVAYSRTGDALRAIQDYDRAIRLQPKFADAYVNRAVSFESIGEMDRALADYGAALRISPAVAYVHYNRATLHFNRGDFQKALADLVAALRNPLDEVADAYCLKGKANEELGRLEEAKADYAEAIRRAGDDADGQRTRGQAHARSGNFRAASMHLSKAQQMSPNDVDAVDALAWFLATCPEHSFRNGERAVTYAIRACELTKWTEGDSLDTLAAAYAEAGEFDKAIDYARRALNRKGLGAFTRKKIQEHLIAFQQQKPWRENPRVVK